MNKINHMRANMLLEEFGISYELIGVGHCDFLNDISDVIKRFMKRSPSVLTIASCKGQECLHITAQSTPLIVVEATAFENCIANLEAALVREYADSSGTCPMCQGETVTKNIFRKHILIRVAYF